MSTDAAAVAADPLSTVDLDALAEKLAEKIKTPAAAPDYQLLGFTIVGSELKATVRTPAGDVFQGVVTEWKKVVVVEVKK